MDPEHPWVPTKETQPSSACCNSNCCHRQTSHPAPCSVSQFPDVWLSKCEITNNVSCCYGNQKTGSTISSPLEGYTWTTYRSINIGGSFKRNLHIFHAFTSHHQKLKITCQWRIQDFSEGAPTYYLNNFYRKLQENEEILAGGRGLRPLDPPLHVAHKQIHCVRYVSVVVTSRPGS